jgi:hypothetical protein
LAAAPGGQLTICPTQQQDCTRRSCFGDDERGTRLEVVGVELADGTLRIIHAMAMRAGYTDLHEEAGNGGSIRKIAEQDNCNVSDVVRDALRRYLEAS